MNEVTTVNDVEKVLARTTALAKTAIDNLSLIYKDGTANEKNLFSVLQEACELEGFSRETANLVSGHKFPDVVFREAHIGVEIKGHKQGDRILGNSIMGSTPSIVNPKAIYLLSWNESNKEVIWSDYFESVIGAEVTHSPRFVLKPGCSPEESLFGDGAHQIGSADDICLGNEGFKSDVILARMRTKALADGNLPWWVSSPEGETPHALEHAQYQLSIIKYSQLPAETERISFLKTLIIGFPALLGRSQTKYDEVLVWSLLRKSVLINRDAFTAGGKHSVLIPSVCSQEMLVLPQVFKRAKEILSSGALVHHKDIEEIWGTSIPSTDFLVAQFKQRAIAVGVDTQFKTVRHHGCSCSNLESVDFANRIMDWLVEEFDFQSVIPAI